MLGLPRRDGAHLLGEHIELHRSDDRLLDVGIGRQPRHRRVQRPRAAREQDVRAAVVRRERLDAHGAGQREDAVLRRADEIAADLGDVAAAEGAVERAAANAVARLEYDDRMARPHQRPGCREAGEAGADDADVGAAGAAPHGGGGGRAQREQRRSRGAGTDELAASEAVVHGSRETKAAAQRVTPPLRERSSAPEGPSDDGPSVFFASSYGALVSWPREHGGASPRRRR
jgi:hypothetical protein